MTHESPHHQSQLQLAQDMEWVQKARKKPADFAPLYNKYYEQIFRFVYKRISDTDQCADITSQVFLKALSSLNSYKDKGLPFSSWLYRIALNEIYMLIRSNKNSRFVAITEQNSFELIADTAPETLKADIETLLNTLQYLDEDEMQLVEMRYFEKRPFREVADILNITENNAKVKMHRVIEKLKTLIKQSF